VFKKKQAGWLKRMVGVGKVSWRKRTMEENIKNDVTRKTRETRETRINIHIYDLYEINIYICMYLTQLRL
jgi:hypothetical protein